MGPRWQRCSNLPLLVVPLLLLSVRQVEPQCPIGCHCSQSLTWVNCSHLELTEIPDDIPENVTTLILSHNLIEILENDTLHPYQDLLELKLDHNLIHTIKAGVFDESLRLSNLNLSNNALTELQPGSLRLPSAIGINLARNQLEWLSRGAFVDCHSLVQLFLDDNRLGSDVFGILNADIPQLQYLDLSMNPVKEIPYLALNRMPHLLFLMVTKSQIRKIDPNGFVGLRSLLYLYLGHNEVDDIRREFFQPLEQVAEIDLAGNPILCQCPVKQFQDWLAETGVALTTPTSCHDVANNEDHDLETGSLDYTCWDNFTSPWPPCAPGDTNGTDCADAAIDINLDPVGHDLELTWEVKGMETTSVAMLGCRELGEEEDINSIQIEHSGKVTLPGVDIGNDVGCCIFVPQCLMHACSDYLAPPGEEDNETDVALIVVSSLLVLMILILTILLVYWLLSGRSSIYTSADDLPASSVPERNTSHAVSSGSSLSTENGNREKGTPRRSVSYRLSDSYGQYEVIDPDTFRKDGLSNHAFERELPALPEADGNVFTVSGGQAGESHTYLEPLPDLPEKKTCAKSPRRGSESWMVSGTWPRNFKPHISGDDSDHNGKHLVHNRSYGLTETVAGASAGTGSDLTPEFGHSEHRQIKSEYLHTTLTVAPKNYRI